jgi:hypothetical protein
VLVLVKWQEGLIEIEVVLDTDYKLVKSELDKMHELYMDVLKADKMNEYGLVNLGLVYLKKYNYYKSIM